MKNLMLTLILASACLAGQAQIADDIYATKDDADKVELSVISPAKQTNEKSLKDRKKLLKQQVDSIGHAKAARALERGRWVLLADRINVGYTGYTVNGLNGNSNFVFQQGDEGMVQFAFNNGNPGLNGMGGMSLEGRVSGEKLTTDKKGNINYNFSLMGTDISAQIMVIVYAGSGYAEAIVQPTFSGPRMTIYGRLVPYVRPRR